nr:uncharacterized protein LOC115260769 [Aedes albopictus]
MDNGRRLNEFLKEVEFNARSEGFSEAELFQGAHHLFTQKARSWYMEVCCEIGSWRELVRELKREFLPVDIDYVYERQAGNRKQGAREKFQDFYLDMVRIFRSMSTPWDEKRKFDVLFRNTRDDCRQTTASHRNVNGNSSNRTNINSITRNQFQKPKPQNAPQGSSVPGTSGTNALERIVRAYIPLKKNVCFNCHEGGHSFSECNQERKVFCERCGFPGFYTKDCPYCQSKNGQKAV